MKNQMSVTIVAVAAMMIAGVTALQARNERIPPPPILISSGGLPGGGEDPWSPDDPYSGGGAGGGYDNNRDYGYPTSGPPGGSGGVDTHGDGGWEWWNNADFWGWGSGWWRYPDPPDHGAGMRDGIGSYDHDRALEDCRIIVTGGNDSRCRCMLQVIRDEQGKIVWSDKVARCSKHDPGSDACRNLNPNDICWHQ